MPHFRIKTISKITNIPVDTIRNWEKRYNFLKPVVGQSGEKLYTDSDIELLRKITTILKTGGRISEIASRVLDGDLLESVDTEAARVGNEVKLMIEDYYQFLLTADLKRIFQLENLIEITVIFKNRVDFIYYPLLERARQDSAKEIITQAQEHFISGHILNKLRSYLSSTVFNYDSQSSSLICATPSNSIYEGSLLTLACTMKLRGHNIYYLGSNLPPKELARFSDKLQPAVVAMSINDPSDLDPIVKVFERVSYPVCVGGIGIRISDHMHGKIGSVHLISQVGTNAADKLESVSVEFFNSYNKR